MADDELNFIQEEIRKDPSAVINIEKHWKHHENINKRDMVFMQQGTFKYKKEVKAEADAKQNFDGPRDQA